MKMSLDSVGYCAYFYEGDPLTIEEVIDRADSFGYDAVDVFPHRPMAFPMDLDKDRRKRIKEHAESKGIELAAIEACTNFMQSDHVLTQTGEKEVMFVKECCELAQDLGMPIVRILAGFVGYFTHETWGLGYSNTAMHGRNMDVSLELDYLKQWEYVRARIAECAEIAGDYGVLLALQNHPPITNSTQDTIDMVEEIDHPNLKLGIDLPLFEQQDEEWIRNTVQKAGDRMIHSHALGIKFKNSLAGPYGFDECVPGEGRENWPAFFNALKEIGYNGYLAYEQCSPVIVKGHKRAGIEEVDGRYQRGIAAMKRYLVDLDIYTGDRSMTELETAAA